MRKKTNKLYVLPIIFLLVFYADILWHLAQREVDATSIVIDVLLILWSAIYLLVPARNHSKAAMVIHLALFVLLIFFKINYVFWWAGIDYARSQETEPRILPTLMAAVPLLRNFIA